ncbi:MAG: glycosyltransferase family 4 protein [Desulfuromonas sp.]
MRVGLLIFGDINTQSGGYLYDRQLTAYLRAQGDTVEIISLPPRTYVGNLRRKTIPAELAESKLDILIQDELVYPRMFNINAKLQAHLNCPIIALIHLLDSSRPQGPARRYLARWAERRYLRSVDGVILNSRSTHHLVNELLHGKMPPHVIAVPAADHQMAFLPEAERTETSGAETFEAETSGVAAAERRSASKHPRLNILYVGNVIHQKGLHLLLKALEGTERDHMRLTVAGRLDMEPGYVKHIHRIIRRKKLGHMVRFTGSLNSSALTCCYQAHDVLVLPSVNEAYGIVYLEAQRFGLPVIGTVAGGAREIIQPGTNGYLLEPGDSKTLFAYLTLLHKDRAHLEMLSANAQHYYRQHPRWDDSCALIRTFLLRTSAGWNSPH